MRPWSSNSSSSARVAQIASAAVALVAVEVDHVFDGLVVVEPEVGVRVLLRPRHRVVLAQHRAAGPSALDPREVVHDAERAQRRRHGGPDRQRSWEAFDLAHDDRSVEAQEVSEHLALGKPTRGVIGKRSAHQLMVARQTGAMRVPRTFAFVDLSGFTRFTDLHGDDEAVAVLTQFRYSVRSIASDVGVRIAKWLGDGAMLVAVEGPSLVKAVVELQERFTDDGMLPVRAGLAWGRVILFEGDDYTGGAVNLASRLCDLAQPFEVLAHRGSRARAAGRCRGASGRTQADPGVRRADLGGSAHPDPGTRSEHRRS